MCSIGAIHHPPIEVGVFLHSFKIKLPVSNGVLVIPSEINKQSKIKWFRCNGHENCTCKELIKTVKKIVINCEDINIQEVLGDFENLEEIEFNGMADIRNSGINNCKKLRRFTFGADDRDLGISGISRQYGGIQEIKMKKTIPIYSMFMFSDCVNLREHWVFNEGVEWIQQEAFNNCKSFVDINLPKSLKCLYIDAFKGCENIKTLRINSLVTLDGPRKMVRDGEKSNGLLDDSPNAVVYCPIDYPVNYLRKYLSPRVTVVDDGRLGLPVSRFLNSSSKIFGLKFIRDIPETEDELFFLFGKHG